MTSLAAFFSSQCTKYIYDPQNPEFSPEQMHFWSIFLGVVAGLLTAFWEMITHSLQFFLWSTIPSFLASSSSPFPLFSSGLLPLPLYHVFLTSLLTGVLLAFLSLLPPLPSQNTWIDSVHYPRCSSFSAFLPTLFNTLLFSTLTLASGLSLGPEMPLLVLAASCGTHLGTSCRQSVLSCRVLSLTASAAALAGFFGLPLAGAIFVLELPHSTGLQFFEALTPATLASIAAVISNRLVSSKAVEGTFKYPPLGSLVPSRIVLFAVLFGVVGGIVGTVYNLTVLAGKKLCYTGARSLLMPGKGREREREMENEREETETGREGEYGSDYERLGGSAVVAPILNSAGSRNRNGYGSVEGRDDAPRETTAATATRQGENFGGASMPRSRFSLSLDNFYSRKHLYSVHTTPRSSPPSSSVASSSSRQGLQPPRSQGSPFLPELVRGLVLGAAVGAINMFVPEAQFWGEQVSVQGWEKIKARLKRLAEQRTVTLQLCCAAGMMATSSFSLYLNVFVLTPSHFRSPFLSLAATPERHRYRHDAAPHNL